MSRKLLLVAALALSTSALAQQAPQPGVANQPPAGATVPTAPGATGAATGATGTATTQPNTTGTATTAQQPGATGMGAATTQPGMGGGTEGMRTLTTSTMAMTFVTAQPTDIVASALMGANVYNKQNESIGEIEDMVIDNGKNVRAVILSIGGFLGLGERHVAVDPGAITLMRAGDGSAVRAVVDATKEQLNNAPAFEYSRRRS